MRQKQLSGVNIQFPISQLILNGEKIVETRTYPLPEKYINRTMWIVETPGKSKAFKSRVVAQVIFTCSFKYESKKHFYADERRHRVTPNSPWAWTKEPKWGWELKIIKVLPKPFPVKQRLGIKFTKTIEIP